jgi:phosphatidylserine synthase
LPLQTIYGYWGRRPHYLLILAMLSTALNMLCGVGGILALIFFKEPSTALQLLLLGAIFDFLDGRFARLSPAKSDLGTYADSLGDVVTFAILPGYMLVNAAWAGDLVPITFGMLPIGHVIGAIFAIAAWFRLVRYAIRPTGVTFDGLPAPAAAILVGSAIVASRDPFFPLFEGGWVLTALTLLSSFLMITTICFPSPKRMLTSDTALIALAGFVGTLNIFFPSTFAAVMMLLCAILYTFFGPLYQLSTESLQKTRMQENSGAHKEIEV